MMHVLIGGSFETDAFAFLASVMRC